MALQPTGPSRGPIQSGYQGQVTGQKNQEHVKHQQTVSSLYSILRHILDVEAGTAGGVTVILDDFDQVTSESCGRGCSFVAHSHFKPF